ncbi:hypothetical protein, partial [Mesorhizobium sp. M8A.F.Ca.ET.208.01.1.1]|uniref:hypothetical protein n=1 Tax=Mesorhizobium sp. M8A.F.Ca.ET.208.01.1.1 TaxID=2563969 RepID=UPI001AEDF296
GLLRQSGLSICSQVESLGVAEMWLSKQIERMPTFLLTCIALYPAEIPFRLFPPLPLCSTN